MGVVAEEGMKQGVEVTGIMPKFLIDKEALYYLGLVIITSPIFDTKKAQLSL